MSAEREDDAVLPKTKNWLNRKFHKFTDVVSTWNTCSPCCAKESLAMMIHCARSKEGSTGSMDNSNTAVSLTFTIGVSEVWLLNDLDWSLQQDWKGLLKKVTPGNSASLLVIPPPTTKICRISEVALPSNNDYSTAMPRSISTYITYNKTENEFQQIEMSHDTVSSERSLRASQHVTLWGSTSLNDLVETSRYMYLFSLYIQYDGISIWNINDDFNLQITPSEKTFSDRDQSRALTGEHVLSVIGMESPYHQWTH